MGGSYTIYVKCEDETNDQDSRISQFDLQIDSTPPVVINYTEGEKIEFYFFSSRRRHTRLVSDWSSDVCSSDLSTLFPYTRLVSDWSSDVCSSDLHTSELQSLTNIVFRLLLSSEERRVGKE